MGSWGIEVTVFVTVTLPIKASQNVTVVILNARGNDGYLFARRHYSF